MNLLWNEGYDAVNWRTRVTMQWTCWRRWVSMQWSCWRISVTSKIVSSTSLSQKSDTFSRVTSTRVSNTRLTDCDFWIYCSVTCVSSNPRVINYRSSININSIANRNSPAIISQIFGSSQVPLQALRHERMLGIVYQILLGATMHIAQLAAAQVHQPLPL